MARSTISSYSKVFQVTLLDYLSDASQPRVLTLVGDEESIQEVAFPLQKYASENIDMTKHRTPVWQQTFAVHSFPVKDITTAECRDWVNKVLNE